MDMKINLETVRKEMKKKGFNIETKQEAILGGILLAIEELNKNIIKNENT